jgi:hypothetical protein
MGEKPKALPGEAPHREEPKLREHDWSSGQKPDRFGAPAWLNSTGGTDNPVCNRCGCELITGTVIYVDVQIVKGDEYVYRTVLGKEVRSMQPLSCPLFGFDAISAAMEGKEIGREAKIEAEKVDIRVDETQYRLTQVEAENRALHEATFARLEQLAAENRALKEQLASVSQIDMGMLAAKLYELAASAKERKALESVESKGRVVQIPKELADVIDVIGIPVEKISPPPDDK